MSVRNEAGLITTQAIDVTPYGHGSWGVPQTTTTGCGCSLGGATTGSTTSLWLSLLGFGFLVFRSRSRRRLLLRTFRGPTVKTLALVLIGGALLVGCGCNKTELQCTVDDDCAKMQCDTGKLPQCENNMCGCTADLPPGNTGRLRVDVRSSAPRRTSPRTTRRTAT